MSAWLVKLAQNVQIIIDLDKFAQKCQESWYELAYSDRDKRERLKTFQVDISFVSNTLSQLGYPGTGQIVRSLQQNDPDQLLHDYLDLSNWVRGQKTFTSQYYDNLYKVMKHLRDFTDQADGFPFTEEMAQKEAERVIAETQQNMLAIKARLEEAVRRIPSWKTLLLKIIPSPSSHMYSMKDDYGESATGALIEFGDDEMAPNFSYFEHEGQIVIDDILEGGDQDFFQSMQVQSDYFNLIRELKSPGSTQRSGKVLRLYTARPAKDRDIYLSGNAVPSGIFLANDLAHVEGLAIDLGGSRDVWRVQINEQYLMQTLDAGRVKEYQVVGEGMVPVLRMDLISPAE